MPAVVGRMTAVTLHGTSERGPSRVQCPKEVRVPLCYTVCDGIGCIIWFENLKPRPSIRSAYKVGTCSSNVGCICNVWLTFDDLAADDMVTLITGNIFWREMNYTM